jgi:membrane associated rhomboid family serine protease
MFRSIINDIKHNFAIGNMINKIIIVNVIVSILTLLLGAFSYLFPFDKFISDHLAISSNWSTILWNPWSFITYSFIHGGIWHLVWNMVGLNLFGRIVGDLLGDKKALPLFLFGAIFSALIFIISSQVLKVDATCIGASGVVMTFALVAALIAPDFNISLLFIGDVKLKYIVLLFIILDIIGSQGFSIPGGHFAHFGGMLAGFLYIAMYKQGFNLLAPFEAVIEFFTSGLILKKNNQYNPHMRVEYNSYTTNSKNQTHKSEVSTQQMVDKILDKINEKGYQNLSSEEKEFLKKASKDS